MQHQPSGRPCAKQCPIDHGTSSCWWCISSPKTPSPRTWYTWAAAPAIWPSVCEAVPHCHGTSSCWWCISSPRTPSPRTWLPTDGPIGITFGWCRANIIPNVVLEVHHDPTTIGALIWVLIGPLILRKFFWYLTTVVTSIWFLTCMTSNMNTQLPLCDKWLTTVVTSIWFLSCMHSNMIWYYNSDRKLCHIGDTLAAFHQPFPLCVLEVRSWLLYI